MTGSPQPATIRAEELSAALIAQLEASGIATGRHDLVDVWPVLRRWFASPVMDASGWTSLECVRYSSLPEDAERDDLLGGAPDELPPARYIAVELSRDLTNGPVIGLALHYPIDDDWSALLLRDDVDPTHPFAWTGHFDALVPSTEFLDDVERSPFFALAATKSSRLTTVYDSGLSHPALGYGR